MIFSLSQTENLIALPVRDNLDIFCFFQLPHAVHCPPELWFAAVASSLKMKHDVLILESSISEFPTWDAKRRWHAGENWSWLSSRSLRTISEAYQANPLNFQVFKAFLKNSK